VTLSLDESQYAYLSTYSGLTNLISTRLYPDRLPEEPTLPAVVYLRVSGRRLAVQVGPGTGPAVRMQYTVFATTRASARAIADQIIAALDGYKGIMGTGGADVTVLEIAGEMDQHDPETDEYQTMLDVILAY
jgi:hypothetical protein